jgi:hypothetical protein
MPTVKLTEATSESKIRPCVIAQQEEEMVLGKTTLDARDGEDHTRNKLVALEMLVESILKKTKLLCTLKSWKQYVGGKAELAQIVVMVLILW